MERAAGPSRKPPQPLASRALRSQPSTSRSPVHSEPQVEASNGVPLVDKSSKKRVASVEIPRGPSKAAATLRRTASRGTSPGPNRDDELLKLLKAEFKALRELVTCSICKELLYEPYTTPCGHTFCYNCLCSTFTGDSRRLKSCPGCRATISHAPAEAFLIRDLTHSFTKHAQLFEPDETIELHEQLRKEHRATIERDKKNKNPRTGGLFKGVFSSFRFPILPMRDVDDGVDRCPQCHWELEDGHCLHCDTFYGAVPPEYFSGYSETGESSEATHPDFVDYVDMDMELEFDEFEEEDDDPRNWAEIHDVDRTYNLRRFFDGPVVPSPMVVIPRNQRLAAHSAAGGHRHASMSDMMESEMGSIAEEEEEDEDTSMDGFIVNESSESQSQGSASASEQTPRPLAFTPTGSSSRASSMSSTDESGNVVPPGRLRITRHPTQAAPAGPSRQPGPLRSGRAVRERQQVTGVIEVDEEDELPIASGRGRPASQQAQVRSTRRRRNVVRDDSEEAEWGHTPIHRQEDGAAGARDGRDGTTVGWEPTTISNDRLRNGGSLTPTAGRPYTATHSMARTGISPFPLGSRGLRRRSSVLSNATARYEDNDADDDGSDADGEGDIAMDRPQLRHQTSRIRFTSANVSTPAPNSQMFGMDGGVDSGESDTTDRPSHRGYRASPRSQGYDPRISVLFSTFQQDLRNNLYGEDNELDSDAVRHLRDLARTPVARPRTANRNRPSNNNFTAPANMNNPGQASRNTTALVPPGRFRTPGGDRNQGPRIEEQVATSRQMPGDASNGIATLPSTSSSSQFSANRALGETLQRPPSRLPSGYSPARRNSGDVQVIQEPYQGTYLSPGLNTARAFQNPVRNPFYNPVYRNPRARPSVQRLRSQPSTATLRSRPSVQRLGDESPAATLRNRNSIRILRPQPSPVNPRSGYLPPPQIRHQTSRISIRNENPAQRLQAQPSARNLRNVHATAPLTSGPPRLQQSAGAPSGQVEERRRANEHIDRQREMSELSSASSSTNNPFFNQRQSTATAPSLATRQPNPRASTIFRPLNATEGMARPAPPQAVTGEIVQNGGAGRRRSGQA